MTGGNRELTFASGDHASGKDRTRMSTDGRHRTALALVICTVLIVGACGSGQGDGDPAVLEDIGGDVAAYVPIHHEVIDLPDDIRPQLASWFPDGESILFNDLNDGEIYTIGADGEDLRCVTCATGDELPKIYSAMSYVFPDGERIFVANELGDDAFVLECGGDATDCTDPDVYPIDLSADEVPGKIPVMRRTYHLAPDGKHLGYTKMRADAALMLVGELEKVEEDHEYVLRDPKVVNPPAPIGPEDTDVDGWMHIAQLYELKSFSEGGSSIIATTGGAGFDFDTIQIDLASGEITSLAAGPDWDEDGAISPDGRFFELASWRTMNRLDVLGLLPLPKNLDGFPLGAAIAFTYVSSFPGFQCDLQPWLLPGDGDRDGTLVGQPLAPFADGDEILGSNNLLGHPMWSPDSARLLLREVTTEVPGDDDNPTMQAKGLPPNRLLIAHLDVDPADPVEPNDTVIGDWAVAPDAYEGPYMTDGLQATIRGTEAGSIQVRYGGTIVGRDDVIVYDGYSEDGQVFLSGETSLTGSPQDEIDWKVDLTAQDASGDEVGHIRGEIHLEEREDAGRTEPPWNRSGDIEASYQGETAEGLPDVGLCADAFPRAPRLDVSHSIDGDTLSVQVSADIAGDERPVQGAVVTVGDHQMVTDQSGRADIQTDGRTEMLVRVRAGDTFEPTEVAVSN